MLYTSYHVCFYMCKALWFSFVFLSSSYWRVERLQTICSTNNAVCLYDLCMTKVCSLLRHQLSKCRGIVGDPFVFFPKHFGIMPQFMQNVLSLFCVSNLYTGQIQVDSVSNKQICNTFRRHKTDKQIQYQCGNIWLASIFESQN